ncbi:MAG TPA: hypothetical protein VD789_06965 [Thermomicrobiales bacterium]|nr:hypothetical protein [Thermomicrobiales bacterium]
MGTLGTKLVILRGNSGSGTSSVAQKIRDRYGHGVAIVGQDNLRRVILGERDVPGGANIGLIDITTRYALNHGYHVVLEGILRADKYGEVLGALAADHIGLTRAYYFDVSFEETLRRHATKPKPVEYGEPEMRAWFRPNDFVPGLNERRIPERSSLDEAAEKIVREVELITVG